MKKTFNIFALILALCVLLMCIILFTAVAARAQTHAVDSFARDGVMYYTYDARGKAIRNFYPDNGLKLCPYCGRMETVKHIKEVAAQYKSAGIDTNFLHPFLLIRDTVKKQYTITHLTIKPHNK